MSEDKSSPSNDPGNSPGPRKPRGGPRKKRALSPSQKIVLLSVLALCVVGGGVTGYLYRSKIKSKVWSWRASTHRTKVEKLMEAGSWPEAHQLAQAANKLDPVSVEGLSLLFRTSAQTNSRETIPVASALYQHPECSFEEKIELLSFFDLSRNDRHFMAFYNRLSEEERKQADSIFLKIRFLISRGGQIAARKMLDEYFSGGGNERRFQGLHARLQIQSSNPEDRRKGQEIIVELMQDSDMVAKQAFGLLGRLPPSLLTPELFPKDLETWVQNLPGASGKERLVLAHLDLARAAEDRSRQEEVFQRAVADLAASEPEPLCDWLLRFRRFDLILKCLDEKTARTSLSLYDHRLRALAVIEGVEVAEAWLEEPHPDSSEVRIWVSRAKLAHLRRDKAKEQENWQEAFARANFEDSKEYLPIFRSAAEVRRWDIAARALLTAAPIPWAAYPNGIEIQPLIAYLYGNDRLQDLNIISLRLLQKEPENIVLRNNAVYLSMVLGSPLPNTEEISRQLVQNHPQILGLRTTLALALLHHEKPGEALKFLDDSSANWEGASAADLAIRTMVLDAAGETDRAAEIRAQINRRSLTTTERRALAAAFGTEDVVDDPDLLYSEIRSWLSKGGFKHARQLLEDYFESGGIDRRFQLLYADLLLRPHYIDQDPDKGQALIAQLMAEPDALSQQAFSLLASLPTNQLRPELFPASLREWIELLPSPGPLEQLTAAKIESLRSENDQSQEALLRELYQSLGQSHAEELARLLVEAAHFDLLLELVPEAVARSSPQLTNYRLQALIKEEGTEAAEQWLQATRTSDSTPEQFLTTAKLRQEQGDRVGSLNAFQRASALADRDTDENHFLAIYEAALEMNQLPVAIRALLSASLHPKGGFPPVADLTPILSRLYQEDRVEDLYTLIQTLLREEPENSSLRDQLAYWSIILRDPTSRALDTAQGLVELHPNILGFQTTLALAYTSEGNHEKALETLPRESDLWKRAPASDQAIYLLVLGNNGQTAEAASLKEHVNLADLTRTEQRALNELKRDPKPADPSI